jgi:molybdate transport system substrate-binding protein
MPKRGGTEFRRCDRAWRVAQAICGTTRAASTRAAGARAAGARAARARAARGRVLSVAVLLTSIAIAPPAPAVASPPDTVIVFAAASLADALTEVAEAFEAETDHSVTLSFAGSAALARQITLGAPADLFISADPAWADTLEDAGLVEPGRRHDLLGNRLVLVGTGPDGPPPEPLETIDLDALLGEGRLAVGLVEAVPAGRYARAALQSAGLWDVAQARLAETDNVRAALALVAIGAAPAGIVYATDASADPRVHVLAHIEPDTHPDITYPLVDLSATDGPGEDALYDFLKGGSAAAIFEAHGFDVLPPRTSP